VVNFNGQAFITVALLNDALIEGAETLTVTAGGATASTVVNDTSRAAAIYSLVANSSSVNEGSTASFTLSSTGVTAGQTFTLLTTNIAAGTSVPYTLTGISAADVFGGSLSGNATVNSSGQATISVALLNDTLTEGTETLTVTAGGATASTVVNDTSRAAATYSLFANSFSVNEGSTASFTLSTNLAAGTSVPYTLTGISAADVLTTNTGVLLSGNAVVNASGQATITVTLLNDTRTEGAETLTVTAGGASASTVVNDTSRATFQTTNTLAIPPGRAISSSAANDLINGTTTTDTVLYSGSIRDYRVAKEVNGSYTVIDTVTNRNGSDVVVNVERIQFAPDLISGANRIALDLAPTQATGKAALLLGAVLPGKLALDPSKYALMGTVIDLFDQGFTLQQLSGAVLRLPIWDALTGKPAPTTTDIATYLINNIYAGSSADQISAARLNAIVQMSAETESTQGTYLASLAISVINQTQIDLSGIQATGLPYAGVVPPPVTVVGTPNPPSGAPIDPGGA
jgi:hypothetical protein